MICRKATVTVNASADMINFSTITLPDGNSCLHSANSCLPGPPSRPPEHKIEVFVRFWGQEPSLLGISSTKIDFLYYFALRNPHFRAFRAQNWHFCAREAGKAALGSQKISVYT